MLSRKPNKEPEECPVVLVDDLPEDLSTVAAKITFPNGMSLLNHYDKVTRNIVGFRDLRYFGWRVFSASGGLSSSTLEKPTLEEIRDAMERLWRTPIVVLRVLNFLVSRSQFPWSDTGLVKAASTLIGVEAASAVLAHCWQVDKQQKLGGLDHA